MVTVEEAEARLDELPPLRLRCSCCTCRERRRLEALVRFYGGWVEPKIERDTLLASAPAWIRDPRV